MALSDTYSQEVFAPSQQVLQQQTAAAQSLPRLHQQGLAIKEAETQQQRLNRPVTPWQKAIMRLMNGEDPAAVARDTRGELAGAGGPQNTAPGVQGSLMGGVQAPPPAQMGYATTNGAAAGLLGQAGSTMGPMMPGVNVVRGQSAEDYHNAGGRVVGNRQPLPAARQFAVDRIDARNAAAAQQAQSQPAPSQGLGSDMYAGMDGRDFNSYIDAMGQARQSKYHASLSDQLALQELRNKGSLAVANVGAGAKRDVAETNAESREKVAGLNRDFNREKLSSKEYADELNRRIKLKQLDENTAHHAAQIQLGYARIKELKERYSASRDQTERFEIAKLLQKEAASTRESFAKVESSLSGIVGMEQEDLRSDMRRKQEEIERTEREFKDEISRLKGASDTKKVTVAGERISAPIQRKYKRKSDGQTIDATPVEFERAIKDGKIKREDWE